MLEEIIPQEFTLPSPTQALSVDWINVLIFGIVAILLVILTRGRLGYQPQAGLEVQELEEFSLTRHELSN
jgi:hypothetical protein